MIDFDVPGLPVDGLVLEDHEFIGFAGEDFLVGFSVVERGDASSFDSDGKLAVLQHEDAGRGFLNSD